MNPRRLLIILCVLGALHVEARGDIVRLVSGKTYEGTVKKETDREIVLEIYENGVPKLVTIQQSDVARVIVKPFTPPAAASSEPKAKPAPKAAPKATREAPTKTAPKEAPKAAPVTTAQGQVSYFRIPLSGEVGKEIGAHKIKEAMAIGLKDPKTILVLEVDSPGGLISECEKIVGLLAAEKDRRTIAYIKRAYSAAAIISLACDEIYMEDNASIGAAAVINIGGPKPEEKEEEKKYPEKEGVETNPPPKDPPKGGNTPIVTVPQEKIQSVWRAVCRKAAEIGGHSPVLAAAMADAEMQIRLVERDGAKTVEQYLEPTQEDLSENRILKTKGKLLTLTAREALRCGLANGVANKLADLETQGAGLAGWKSASNRGDGIMNTYRADVKKADAKLKQYLSKLEDSFNLAVENDPTTPRYQMDSGGRFTQASREKWMARSKACYDHLKNCERIFQSIIDMGKSFPFLEGEVEACKEYKERFRKLRDRIERGANRPGSA